MHDISLEIRIVADDSDQFREVFLSTSDLLEYLQEFSKSTANLDFLARLKNYSLTTPYLNSQSFCTWEN